MRQRGSEIQDIRRFTDLRGRNTSRASIDRIMDCIIVSYLIHRDPRTNSIFKYRNSKQQGFAHDVMRMISLHRPGITFKHDLIVFHYSNHWPVNNGNLPK